MKRRPKRFVPSDNVRGASGACSESDESAEVQLHELSYISHRHIYSRPIFTSLKSLGSRNVELRSSTYILEINEETADQHYWFRQSSFCNYDFQKVQ